MMQMEDFDLNTTTCDSHVLARESRVQILDPLSLEDFIGEMSALKNNIMFASKSIPSFLR